MFFWNKSKYSVYAKADYGGISTMGRHRCKIGGATFREVHPAVMVLIQQHAVDARSTFVQLFTVL